MSRARSVLSLIYRDPRIEAGHPTAAERLAAPLLSAPVNPTGRPIPPDFVSRDWADREMMGLARRTVELKFRGSKWRRVESSPASFMFESHRESIQLQALHHELIHFLIEHFHQRLGRTAQSLAKVLEAYRR